MEIEIETLQKKLTESVSSADMDVFKKDLDGQFVIWEKEIKEVKTSKFMRDVQDFKTNSVYKWYKPRMSTRSSSISSLSSAEGKTETLDVQRFSSAGRNKRKGTNYNRKYNSSKRVYTNTAGPSKLQVELLDILEEAFIDGLITKDLRDGLVPDAPRTPCLYLLPKVHKNLTCPTGRPIVSGNGGLTENVGKMLDFYLKPIVETLPSYLRDTGDILSKISNINMEPDMLLVTLDVESLYTSIRHADGMEAEALYLQLQGTAMGAAFAPSYACLFLGLWERKIFITDATPLSSNVLMWARYIDDVFAIWQGTEKDLLKFIDDLNVNDSNIKLTCHYSRERIDFLDVCIRRMKMASSRVIYIGRKHQLTVCYTPHQLIQDILRTVSHMDNSLEQNGYARRTPYIKNKQKIFPISSWIVVTRQGQSDAAGGGLHELIEQASLGPRGNLKHPLSCVRLLCEHLCLIPPSLLFYHTHRTSQGRVGFRETRLSQKSSRVESADYREKSGIDQNTKPNAKKGAVEALYSQTTNLAQQLETKYSWVYAIRTRRFISEWILKEWSN
ncbi:unnamed protein product [Ranitomeya imitator]|uniref:Reverse transcriptase domain-containing protein n=1 Tax=Ranitomeya imitator TaxID=111125 RepID=A0ABN9MB41_9NEOB|nr:unnamed protein product [Ranitomeya imitator]